MVLLIYRRLSEVNTTRPFMHSCTFFPLVWMCIRYGSSGIDNEGWLHTGDIAILDSKGYIEITGRIKDMVIRGGENIYPRELE